MRPQFDERDAEILKEREETFNKIKGPRVGDFLRTSEGYLRFTHDWGESIQTTVRLEHPCYGDASFYLGNGFASFSGSLDPAIPKKSLMLIDQTADGSFWFFHHDVQGAHRGVHFSMKCRVFKQEEIGENYETTLRNHSHQ